MEGGAAPGSRHGRRWRRAGAWLCLLALATANLAMLADLAFPMPLAAAGGGTVVVASNGAPLRMFADAEGRWRHPVTEDEVSPLYLDALVAYEDRRFRSHPGVDPLALLRAGAQWLRHGEVVSGGSTLTMQVARILDPPAGGSRSIRAKLRQVLRALQLEAHLSKEQILELYLNHAPFGGTIEGVEAASWAYLGKPASRLSRAEAALLVVLPQAPSRWRPDRAPEEARAARDKVLARMATMGVWTQGEVDDARIEPVVARSLRAPRHAALLARRLKAARPGEHRIASTLDFDLQRTLEERVASYFSHLPARTSAALLVVDNATMEARAYVGSVAFADRERLGHVDMVQAWRSPGSTLKPFLYGLAIDDGLIHSGSLLVDAPQDFGGYRPGNFDAAFQGPVSAGQALQLSLNVPAVDVLDRVGPARFAARLAHAGIDLHWPRGAQPNLSMILGGTGARLEDLVGAHAALNRRGLAGRVRFTVDDPRVERRLLSREAAWIVRQLLEEHPRPGAMVGFDASRRARVAWKTGTSYGFRDAWALGGTRSHTVGVWVGRPDGTPLPGQYGAVTALPLMFEVIDALPGRAADSRPAPPPPGVERRVVCWPLGLPPAASPGTTCQRRVDAWTLAGVLPPTAPERGARLWSAGLERFEVDAASGHRLSAECREPHSRHPAAIARWPALASSWLSGAERRASRLPPLAADCRDDGRDGHAELRIEGVDDRSVIAAAPGDGAGDGLRLSVRAIGSDARVRWLLDGRLVGESIGGNRFVHEVGAPGIHSLTALVDTGAWDRVEYRVMPRATDPAGSR